jgi:hypothetical protein
VSRQPFNSYSPAHNKKDEKFQCQLQIYCRVHVTLSIVKSDPQCVLLPVGHIGVPVGLCELVLHVLLEVLDAAVDDGHVAHHNSPDQVLGLGQLLPRERVAQSDPAWPRAQVGTGLGLPGRLDVAHGVLGRVVVSIATVAYRYANFYNIDIPILMLSAFKKNHPHSGAEFIKIFVVINNK